jgi:hypothetical protein
MLMEQAAPHGRLRAPQEDGQALIEPSWPSLPDLVTQNRRQLAGVRCDVQGRPLLELAADARRSLLQSAIAFTSQYRDIPDSVAARAAAPTTPILLSGHQPDLVHPGVWYKNFVLGRLAERTEGVGVHLLIDSDLCREASIRVPSGTPEQPRLELVPLDGPAAEVPYEERVIHDPGIWRQAPDRVTQLLSPFVRAPIIRDLWSLMSEQGGQPRNLGLCLAQGRHKLEESWGNVTLELPQSAVCQMPEFAWFAAHLLAHLPRFWAAHNESLAEYRRVHRLRNRAQPVPDLAAEGDGWLEAPFWIWSADDPERRPLYARQEGDVLLVTDRASRTVEWTLSADGDAALAAEQWADLALRGVRIRTRALVTTLFARLFLGDLFLHGIGGAKYDQVTDAIGKRFFGVSLPEIAVVSATLWLPVEHRQTDATQQRALRQQLRELQFHPERFVLQDGAVPDAEKAHVAEQVAEKQRWIDTPKTVQNARQRHEAIVKATESLSRHVAHLRAEIARQLDQTERRMRASAILDSREYAFCLFPEEHLQRLLLDDPVEKP